MVRTLRVGHDLHACGGVPLLATALDGWSTRQQLVSTPHHLFHLRILALHVHFRKKHTVFISVYGVVTTIMPVAYFIDIGVYMSEERTGVDPPVPWWIIQTMDVLWVLCLASTTSFCIPEPPLEIRCKVLQFDEEYDVPENAALIGGLPSTDRNDEGGKRQEEVHVQ